jgi:hypothetical protein
VLFDDAADDVAHSVFLGALEDRGYVLSSPFRVAARLMLRDPSVHGDWLYDNVLCFSDRHDFTSGFSLPHVLALLQAGRNVVLMGSGTGFASIAGHLGFSVAEPQSRVVDHFSAHQEDGIDDTGAHDTILTTSYDRHGYGGDSSGNRPTRPVVYRGVGMAMNNSAPSSLLLPILRAGEMAHTKAAATQLLGRDIVLVGAWQSASNGRIVLAGSSELCSDAFINANVSGKNSGNLALCEAIVGWAFHEVAHVRMRNMRIEGKDGTEVIAVRDSATVSAVVEEWVASQWVPYTTADPTGIQYELRVGGQLYARKTFSEVLPDGTRRGTVRMPDRSGVVTLRIDHHGHPGSTHLVAEGNFSVRPLCWYERENLLKSLFPLYAAVISGIIGMIFSRRIVAAPKLKGL